MSQCSYTSSWVLALYYTACGAQSTADLIINLLYTSGMELLEGE
jgi:hypothetical protein